MITQPPRVSVLIVSYCTRALTLACLESVYDQTDTGLVEVIVVDNASDDGSAEAIASDFPQARLVQLSENRGFAGANNLAGQMARGKFILLLNPDTVILDNAIERLWEFAEANPSAGIWGGRTVFADGSLNPTSSWAEPTLWSMFLTATGVANKVQALNPESMYGWRHDSIREVDIVTGCFLLIERSLWISLDGFDETFFMYGEDADLCLRARDMGYNPLVTPDATIIHIGGASERIPADKLVRLFTAKAQLLARHWGPLRGRLGLLQLDLWAALRTALLTLGAIFITTLKPKQTEWISVLRRRAVWRQAYRAVRASKKTNVNELGERTASR